jgi:multiple sugar transport system substrate-binding protein
MASNRRVSRRPSQPRAMQRRDFLKLTGGVAGASMLGACAGFGGGGDSAGGGGDSGALVFAFGPDDLLPSLFKQFEEEKGIKVNYQVQPTDTGQYFDKLRTEFQAGTGAIDVIAGDVIWPAQFAASGYIVDLTDKFTNSDEYLDGPIQANTYQGKLYGVPFFTDAGMLYYRKDLLEKSGIKEPPTTYSDLYEMAEQVQGESNLRFGYVFQGANYEGGVCNGSEYVWNHGGDILNPEDPTEVVINSPEAIAGLEAYRESVDAGVAPDAVAAYKEPESQAAFLNGDSVFMRNWPYIFGLLPDPKESKIKPEQVDVSPLPVGESGVSSSSALGGWNFMINADSDKQDEAWELVQFLSTPEIQKQFALKESLLPTLTALYEEEDIINKLPAVKLGGEAVQNSRPRPVSPFYSDMSLELAEGYNTALKGEVPPEEAVATIEESLQSIIEQGA